MFQELSSVSCGACSVRQPPHTSLPLLFSLFPPVSPSDQSSTVKSPQTNSISALHPFDSFTTAAFFTPPCHLCEGSRSTNGIECFAVGGRARREQGRQWVDVKWGGAAGTGREKSPREGGAVPRKKCKGSMKCGLKKALHRFI